MFKYFTIFPIRHVLNFHQKEDQHLGEAATAWKYIDELDKVYASRIDIIAPEAYLSSALSPLNE